MTTEHGHCTYCCPSKPAASTELTTDEMWSTYHNTPEQLAARFKYISQFESWLSVAYKNGWLVWDRNGPIYRVVNPYIEAVLNRLLPKEMNHTHYARIYLDGMSTLLDLQ